MARPGPCRSPRQRRQHRRRFRHWRQPLARCPPSPPSLSGPPTSRRLRQVLSWADQSRRSLPGPGVTVAFLEAEDKHAAATGGTTSPPRTLPQPMAAAAGGAAFAGAAAGDPRPLRRSRPLLFQANSGSRKCGSSKQPKVLPKDPPPHLTDSGAFCEFQAVSVDQMIARAMRGLKSGSKNMLHAAASGSWVASA